MVSPDIYEDFTETKRSKWWLSPHFKYKHLVDVWMLYDNSGEKPLLIDAGGKK
jgi:hypothetical protein